MQTFQIGDREVVRAEGELDLSHAQDLRAALEDAQTRSEADVVLDLTGALYIDSAILQELIRAHNALSKQDRQFAILAKDNSQPGQVLRTVMFHTIMKIRSSLEELAE